MIFIESIYILTEDGDPLFIRESYPQGWGKADHALFSDFLTAFHLLAIELGATRINTIGLTKCIIYSRFDEYSKIRFIVKCKKQATPSVMKNYLDQLKVYFLSTCREYLNDNLKIKNECIPHFTDYVNELLILGKNFSNFIDTL
jgi:hypothetical protein